MSSPHLAQPQRTRTGHATNLARTLAWAEAQLAAQNDALREALDGADPAIVNELESACRPARRVANARTPLGSGRA